MSYEEIDLRHYFEILWKWKWVIALLTGIAMLTSAVFSFFVLSPVYETKVTLLVANAAQNQQSMRPQGDGSVVDTVSKIPVMTLNTYMSQINSPYFLKRVIDKLQLKEMDPSQLSQMITTQILKDTNLIEVRVQNTDKTLATRIANTIASEFVQFVSETNQERMTKSLAFLSEQKNALKKELDAAYAALKKLQQRPDNVSSLQRQITLSSDALARFRQDLVDAELQRDLLKAGISQAEAELSKIPSTVPGSSGEPIPNPVYQSMSQSLNEKRVKLAEVQAKIAGLEREIYALESSLTELEGRLTVVQNEEQEVKANLQRIESTLSLLEAKTVEAQMAQSVNFGETTISVISPALEPKTPVKPRKMLNLAVSGVLGLFVSVLLVFILEYLDNTIKDQEDVQKYLNLGTLGMIPLVADGEKRRQR